MGPLQRLSVTASASRSSWVHSCVHITSALVFPYVACRETRVFILFPSSDSCRKSLISAKLLSGMSSNPDFRTWLNLRDVLVNETRKRRRLALISAVIGSTVHRLLDAAQVCDCARVCTVNGMRLHMQWCSFILGFLSERECKHRPLAKLGRPQRCQHCSLGLILVPLGHSTGEWKENGRHGES